MNWFGRKAAGREAARPALARVLAGGAWGDWPRGYDAQLRDAYLGNAVAQRAVKLVAESVGGAPLSGDPALLALVSAASAGQRLIETVAAQLLLHGNSFVQIIAGADGRPAELFALRPERVTIEADAGGWPVGFVYRVGERTRRFDASEIVQLRSFHPADDHYGLGCLGAASAAVAIHNAAARWSKALLDNAARPSGALVHDGGADRTPLSGAQFDRLKAELESGFQGAGNAGRPMLLEGGLSWQAMSLTPADMDFAATKAAAAREIALAFGVPPMLLGLPGDSTYANYREANRALWRLSVLPLAATILRGLAQGLAAWWPGASLEVDIDRVTALAEERERAWRMIGGAGFLSDDEKRDALGF